MGRAVVIAFVIVALAGRSARADGSGPDAPGWAVVYIGLAMGAAVELPDAIGFGVADLVDRHHGTGYGAAELAVNLPLAAILTRFAWGTDGDPVHAMVFALAGIDSALAIHGAWTIAHSTGSSRETLGVAAAYAGLTTLFVAQDRVPRGRAYAVVETAVNLPVAGALAYGAYREGGARGALLGTGSALSLALAIHGVRLAFNHDDAIVPIAIGEGRDLALGLGAAGTW